MLRRGALQFPTVPQMVARTLHQRSFPHSAVGLRLAVVVAFAYSSQLLCESSELRVTLSSELRAGTKILATVEATGDVLVESELAAASFVSRGEGIRKVDLGGGRLAEIGFHRIRFSMGTNSQETLLPILSSETSVRSPPSVGLVPTEQAALNRFYSALKNRGVDYASKWPMRRVVIQNSIKITTAGTLVLICATEPSRVSCIAAATTTGDLLFEGALDYLSFALDQMAIEELLNKQERETIRQIIISLKASKVVLDVTLGPDVAQKVVAGLDVLTLPLDQASGLSLIIGMQRDSAGKAVKLLHVLRKAK